LLGRLRCAQTAKRKHSKGSEKQRLHDNSHRELGVVVLLHNRRG